MKISVAMATYNGAKYLAEQLQSLKDQELPPYELVICDDGSTDDTVSILESFAESSSFPVRIYRNETRLGYSDNFLKAAKLCEGDWIAFCDQDDVWLPNKINNAVKAIQSDKNALIILQNAWLCYKDNKKTKKIIPDTLKQKKYRANHLPGFFMWHGFIMTVKKEVVSLGFIDYRPNDPTTLNRKIGHDQICVIIANSLGGVCVLGQPVAYYRRHDQAVTGMHNESGFWVKIHKSLHTGKSYYYMRKKVALKLAIMLRGNYGKNTPEKWVIKFMLTSRLYIQMASIYSLREQIYSDLPKRKKIYIFIRILINRGYFMNPFLSMGIASGCKDLTYILFSKLIKNDYRVS